MGLGKTLICLAAIIATKGHWPKIPPQYSTDLNPIRGKTGTLMQMTAAAIGREQIPWKTFFQARSGAGEDYGGCITMLEENVGSYIIPPTHNSNRVRRPALIPKGERIYLCTATLIIVPQNLFFQWTNQIALHLNRGSLKVLHMETNEIHMPPTADLLSYDIILMSKNRFEREMKSVETEKISPKGREDYSYQYRDQDHRSSLQNIHFLRMIVDEGHDFASSGRKNNAIWALQNLHVERRWIVSGTPAASLLGVELDLAVNETRENISNQASEQEILEARRFTFLLKQERQDLERLGRIVTDFLQIRPWANDNGEDLASWQKYVMPSKDGNRKPKSLKSILESLIVRHRIEDVDADIQLPPLQNKVVYLEPSWHDKLSINLFILTLTANAVTSERTDQDYMFHHSNRAQLDLLITNLRHSGFYWVSFSPELIMNTLDFCGSYLNKKSISNPYSYGTTKDHILLKQVMETGYRALASSSWKAFAEFQELGIFVEGFPEDSCNSWSLIQREAEDPLLTGATQMIKAQKYVDSHLYSSDPAYGLAELGNSVMKAFQLNNEVRTEHENLSKIGDLESNRFPHPKKSLPRSKNLADLRLTEKHTMSKARGFFGSKKKDHVQERSAERHLDYLGTVSKLKSALKTSASLENAEALSSESPLARAKIIGTASSKLSYLVDRVLALQQDEKILVFYRGDHIAYFIAQAFDLVNVRYLIYTGTITTDRRSIYITTFNKTETFRVMLMDVRQAAHGLHIASASRVFFVNPEWQPNVEAQAIKRAHRIGQTRPVYVETLVLKGTLEDQMLQRRKKMTTEEHQTAQKSLIDDPVMKELIENLKPILLSQDEINNPRRQIALLRTPQRIFGRVAKGVSETDNPNSDLILPEGAHSWKAKPGTRKRQFSYQPSPDSADIPLSKRGKSSPPYRDVDEVAENHENESATSSPPYRDVDEVAENHENESATSSPLATNTSNNRIETTHHPLPEITSTIAPRRRVAFSLNQDRDDENNDIHPMQVPRLDGNPTSGLFGT